MILRNAYVLGLPMTVSFDWLENLERNCSKAMPKNMTKKASA
jgi:hypothetical protein